MNNLFSSSSEIEDKLFPPKITLHSRGKLFLLDKPWVMGIMNITTDSFHEKSRVAFDEAAILNAASKMINEGADILDIGGYSSRPGADDVPESVEINRVVTAITAIRKEFPDILISVDTFRSKVALEAVNMGASMVNDISAGELDEQMIPTVGKLKVPYIAMHMRGNPKNMKDLTSYEDIVLELMTFFSKKLNQCIKAGINDVILDPGLGFSKTLEQNYCILKNLYYFKSMQIPILIGLSRKSMIYKILNIDPSLALNGTTALHMAALLNGANILRVHDVKEAKETITLFKQLYT
ncbi:dihydropteroate synthase [Belliella sp. DSM 111904]|uniref:dihydropteroate synthase n=1 Tax=Belliella filtrata TaxID=2923435 RepID=A0ABS9UY00_9BACT|nr:dihydropteroate synthase [Belliella filtrata]MCH7409051.1 dihydropteroate synthase [Belliella filtrata]